MTMPEAYGGAGGDKLYSVVQMEELARGGWTGIGYGLHNEIVAPYLLHYGTEAQKNKYLPALASGVMVGAIAMSEPTAGSDLQGIRSTAIRQPDGSYLLNGSKTFITNGWHADLVIAVAKTDPQAGAKGTSLLLVERGMQGFEAGKRLKKLGLKAQDTSELFFHDVRVPAENLLGGAALENRGFVCLMEQLPWERMQISVTAVAAAQAAIDWTVQYVMERKVFGQSVARTRTPATSWPSCRPRCRWRRSSSTAATNWCCRARSTPPPPAWPSTGPPTCSARSWTSACNCIGGYGLHVGVPDHPRLCRCPRAAHLRRHQRDHEGSDIAFDRAAGR
jgi:hypothetical protein